MFKVRTYNTISPLGLNRFPRDSYEVGPGLEQPDAIILRSQKLHDEVIPSSVLAIGRAGAGVNNIPVADYTKKGIVVFNTPGANANAVKELIAAALFLSSRDIYGGISYVETLGHMSDGAEMSKLLEKEKKRFAGSELLGKTLGVVGLGAIGSMVANMALELGMHVMGYDPAISVEAAWRLHSSVEKMDSLSALLSRSDYITLHVPAIEATRHLINRETLATFKKGAKLLNFAREEIVETSALLAALDSGHLGGYTADFPAPGLIGKPNVLLTPHIGASTREAEENCAIIAADQLIDFLQNGNIKNSVNFPPTAMARSGGHRLTFSNNNVPKVLSNVLAILSESNNNVIDLVNKSRENVAYNIIDVEQKPSAETIAKIRATEGVIHVRVL
ncbi:MAG: phosphoglycerate dehydrogenase [Porticoccaceae bacterium]|nr:phosphoglycerate dehydrogenase [Porticoccaceae bacterium]